MMGRGKCLNFELISRNLHILPFISLLYFTDNDDNDEDDDIDDNNDNVYNDEMMIMMIRNDYISINNFMSSCV